MKCVAAVLVLAVLAPACSPARCRTAPACYRSGLRPSAVRPAARRFLVLRAKPLPEAQLLIEGTIVEVAAAGRVAVLDRAEPVAGTAAPTWMGGTDAPDVLFGPTARVVHAPRMLVLDGQDATLFIGTSQADGSMHDGWHMSVTPTLQGERIQMVVGYQRRDAGKLVDAVAKTTITGPAGRVFILESLPVR